MARLLAEIGKARRAHALDIAAHRGERQIDVEDLVLAQPRFDLQRAGRLQHLAGKAARDRLQHPRDLHGQRRRARDDAEIGDQLPGGAADGGDIDARMIAEAPVLIGEQQPHIARIDILQRDRQTPFVVRRQEAAQHRAVGGEHDGRAFVGALEIRREDEVRGGQRQGADGKPGGETLEAAKARPDRAGLRPLPLRGRGGLVRGRRRFGGHVPSLPSDCGLTGPRS